MSQRWRFYKTAAGNCPVSDFLQSLSAQDAAGVAAAMSQVLHGGLVLARHLRTDLYEVRAAGDRVIYRVLFSVEGRGHVLLALEAFQKTTQKTPNRVLALAEARLHDWRARGDH